MDGFERRTEEKEKVLRAAFDLMNTDTGIENLTIDAVAKKANVGKLLFLNILAAKKSSFMKSLSGQWMKWGKAKNHGENASFEETLIAMSQNKIDYLEKSINNFT